jgi:hypothetical protein
MIRRFEPVTEEANAGPESGIIKLWARGYTV